MENSNLLHDSALDILVPEDSQCNIEQAVNAAAVDSHAGSDSSRLLSFVTERDLLHFDELIPLYIVLRTPYEDDIKLNSFIARLAITIGAYAFSTPKSVVPDISRDPSPSPGRDIIWSSTVNSAEGHVINIQHDKIQETNHHCYVIWKVIAYLNRLKIRSHSSLIVFRPSGTLRPPKPQASPFHNDYYLSSDVPASVNLLESLAGDPIFQGVGPQFSAARLSRSTSVVTSATVGGGVLRVLTHRAFRAQSAINAKVRYSAVSSHVSRLAVIASLDIETTPILNTDIIITAVSMQISGGVAEDLSSLGTMKLPVRCRPRDSLVFLFQLVATEDALRTSTSNQTLRNMEIAIHANVMVSEICCPTIEMHWTTGVDFSIALNLSYGAPNQSLQQDKRPANLPVTPTTASHNTTSTSSQGSEATNGVSEPAQHQTISVGNIGVTLAFTAPKEVRVGQPFSWEVLVVNRSSTLRKLVLSIIPKRSRGDIKGHYPRSSSSSTEGRKGVATADAIMDENLLYAVQRTVGTQIPLLIPLSTDLKIGPLNPDGCYSAELKFLPLAHGVLLIEAVRVTDLGSNVSVDIRDIPDIVAAERIIDE